MEPIGGGDKMKLNRKNLESLSAQGKNKMPGAREFELPEKVLQFGTGVLLRGLPDYFISIANRQGVFNGRIVVVKSTDKGDTKAFDEQDNLYTLVVRGLDGGKPVREEIVCAAISRVISAQSAWEEILALAESPELEIVISNTTEKGILYLPEKVEDTCPQSFPGKLLAVLYHRYKTFNAASTAGLIILPTELITENGKVLREILNKLAAYNSMDLKFIEWMNEHNQFCNTLVDRIVPGAPVTALHQKLERDLGYEDELLIMSESYALWAIEGPAFLNEKLSFVSSHPELIIAEDIATYKELKLRLLNGTHTLSCAVAMLSGFETVKEAMSNQLFRKFLSSLIEEELSFGIPLTIDREQTLRFGSTVADRFSNPDINHLWINISANYTLKMDSRVVPAILEYYNKFNACPERMAFGFAAYLYLMSSAGKQAYDFSVDDTEGNYLAEISGSGSIRDYVHQVLSNKKFWHTDLNNLNGFTESVTFKVELINASGITPAMASVLEKSKTGSDLINEIK